MLKRLIEVIICYPIVILGILFNTIVFITSIIWGPIYYIITGNDPLTEESISFFTDLADKINKFILDKLFK